MIVEERPYDVLLERCPLPYSAVKLPWMNKPLYVTWPT
ncbi:contractile injection system tape measure protein [Thalassolituus sp. UBA3500]